MSIFPCFIQATKANSLVYYLLPITASILFPLIAPFFLGVTYRRMRHPFFAAVTIGIFFGMLASCIDTLVEADIDRYAASIEQYEGISLAAVFFEEHSYSGQYGFELLCWILANFGLGFLLNFIVGFVAYGASSYIILDYGLRMHWSDSKTALILCCFILLVPFFNMISYVRSTLAFSLLSLALYFDLCAKPRKNGTMLALYIAAPLFHVSTLPILLIRIAVLVTQWRSIRWLCAVLLLAVPAITFLQPFISSAFANIPILSILSTASDRLILYTNSSEKWAIASLSSPLVIGYRIFFAAIALAGIWFSRNMIRENRHKDIASVVILWSSFTLSIAMFISYDVFFRYAMPLTLFVLLMWHSSPSRGRGVSRLLIAICLVFLVIAGAVVQVLYLSNVVDIQYLEYHFSLGLLGFFF